MENKGRQYEQSSYPGAYMSGPRAWEADEFNVQRARDIYGSTSFRPAELLTTPPTSLPQAAGAGEDIHALRSFEYAQGHQYPVIQTLGSAFQYQPETLQYSPQRTSQISHQAQTQFPYDYMPQYQPEQRQPDSYGDYQQSLKETNQKTSEGRLIEAAESLKNLSKWFLGNVKGLGLTTDMEELRREHLKLWREFNFCWLALLQRQLDDSQGRRVSEQKLSEDSLENLGNEITQLCDGLQKYGLSLLNIHNGAEIPAELFHSGNNNGSAITLKGNVGEEMRTSTAYIARTISKAL